jgi:YjjG family noncanonical pyrimidine nucleotidase
LKKEYKAIFFDADDTLYDYPRAERAALLACCREFAIAVAPEAFIAVYRRHNRDVWQEFERGETDQATLRVERFRRLGAELGLADLPFDLLSTFYLEVLSGQAQLLPGALELVRELAKKFPLALVTNGIAAVQNRRFAASPITPYFHSIVISEEVGIAKPDPRIFAPALEKLGVDAADVLYVGDSVSSDMAAARNAGMDFCWLNPRGIPVPAGHDPAFIVKKLSEIPAAASQPQHNQEADMHPIEKRSLKHGPFNWLTFLLEMVMIVFSILLALNLESWREGRKEREQARSALQNISSEIRQNRKAVSAAIPLHHQFTDHLQETIAKLDKQNESGAGKGKGIGIDFELRPPHLYQAAWQTVLSTQVLKKTDYQTILAIAELYEMQRWMSLIEEKILQAMLAPGAFDPKNLPKFLTVVYMLYRDYTSLEERLVGQYDHALKRIASQANEK